MKKNDAGQRTDKFLSKTLSIPHSLIYKYLRIKRIRRNGKRARPEEFVSEGDIFTLYINDEFFDKEKKDIMTPGGFEIVYEDDKILLIDKPAGLLCHGESGEDTLIGRVQYYLYHKGEYNPQEENSFAPALCNRLDRNTSGLVIAAKTAAALREINERLKNREIKKYYLCLVQGVPKDTQGQLNGYLLKDDASNKSSISDTEAADSKAVSLSYKTLDTGKGLSLLEIELHTGRPHQIRSQLAHMGNPIVGDSKYGGKEKYFEHQALCAYRVKFDYENKNNSFCGKSFEVKDVWFRGYLSKDGKEEKDEQ